MMLAYKCLWNTLRSLPSPAQHKLNYILYFKLRDNLFIRKIRKLRLRHKIEARRVLLEASEH